LPDASRIRLPRQWRHPRRRQSLGRLGPQDHPDNPEQPDNLDKKAPPARLERPARKAKKLSQGRTERPALPEQLERPVPPVRLEQRAQMDEKTGRLQLAYLFRRREKGKGMQPSLFYCYNGPRISICLEREARLDNGK
jgi:hypothetical protein